jgi:hypothetical protein
MVGTRVADYRATGLRPKADVVSRRLGESAVLIDLQTNVIFELNGTGFRIWELLLQELPVEAMAARLHEEFGVDPARAAAEIEALLARLRDERLVVEQA